MLVITLATVATGYIFSSGSTAWIGASTTSSSDSLAIVVVVYVLWRRSQRLAQASDANS
jgi:hypothetical protein